MSSYPPYFYFVTNYNALTRSALSPLCIIITWLIFCLYCKPAEVSMSAGGYRQTECWIPTCPASVTDMTNVGAPCRLSAPLSVEYSGNNALASKYISTRFFYSSALQDWRPRSIDLIILLIKIIYTHTIHSLSLVVSSIQGVMFSA